MSFEIEQLTMANTSTFKCVMRQMITLCWFVIMKNKQKLNFSGYYKTITLGKKHEMRNVSFKTFSCTLAQ